MIRTRQTMSGSDVLVGDVQIGCIDREGFFTGPVTGPDRFVRMSAKELRELAAEVDKHVQQRLQCVS